MKYYNKIQIAKTIIVLLVLQLMVYAQVDQSINNSQVFDQKVLDHKIFQLEQNETLDTADLISSSQNEGEKVLLNSILLYKENRFNETFNLLYAHTKIAPNHYKYYEYLAKTAHILGKTRQLLSYTEKEDSTSILAGFINYNNGEYQKARLNFKRYLEKNKDHIPTYIYLANTYRRLGNYQKANELLSYAELKISDQNPNIAEIIISKGSLAFLSGDYDLAEKFYNSGLKFAKNTNNYIEILKATLNLAMIKDLYSEIDQARILFNDAYMLAEKINHSELQAIVLSEWAVSFTYTNEPIEARSRYEESFQLLQKFNNKERLALTATNIANLFLTIGNNQAALKHYNNALEISNEDIRTQVISMRGLGDVYTNLANYAKAIEYYDKARKKSREIKDIVSETNIDLGMSIMYYNLGQPQRALEILIDSNDKMQRSKDPYLKAELFQKIGIYHLALNNNEDAEEFLLNSIKLSEENSDIYTSILSKMYIVQLYISKGNKKLGKKILNDVIELSEQYNLYQLLATQKILFAEISNREETLNILMEAERFALKANHKSSLIEIYNKLGNYYKDRNERDLAEKYFIRSISEVENQLTSLRDLDFLQIDFFSEYYEIYSSLIDLYISNNKLDKAFYILDLNRARNTAYNLAAIKLKENDQIELVNKYYDLTWKLNTKVIEATDSTNSILNHLKTELGSRYKYIFTELYDEEISKINLYDSLLSEDEYFISYYTHKENIYIFIKSNSSLSVKKLDVKWQALEEMISSLSPFFNNNYNDGKIEFNSDLFSYNMEKSHQLYDKILLPIMKEIPIGSKLIFSLNKDLNTVPFEFLCTSDREEKTNNYFFSKNYLIEDYSVSYIPSLSILTRLRKDVHNSDYPSMLIGDPVLNNPNQNITGLRGAEDLDFYSRNLKMSKLKYSKVEIEKIENIIGADLVLLGNNATESNLKMNSKNQSIIHVSTHSFLFNNYPVIVLNADGVNDGYLEIGEVAGLNIQSDLVVLSSCKSGLGKQDNAEGILGMQKAFFDAGTSNIILSHWDVSDKYTSIFMQLYYEFLSEGYDFNDALRLTKIKFINEVNPNPYYWAAFTLAGNATAKLKIKKSNNFLTITLFGTLFLISTLFFRKRIINIFLKHKS